ncbi:hypothetical protein HPB48_003067 [Haemaphysalis longicornis]|uniref:Uncharacterized protein n=1 Tax=Haemaphysalis longicornis TaxID=44386 RepID=A0A9J6FTP0_HAELO|nr:hypothetical protein HPB48_003067 [Haemaphysalis longicornis]
MTQITEPIVLESSNDSSNDILELAGPSTSAAAADVTTTIPSKLAMHLAHLKEMAGCWQLSRNCHIFDDGSSVFIFTFEICENEVVRLYPGTSSVVETNDPERKISGSVPLKLLLRHAKEVSIEGTDPAFVMQDGKAAFGSTTSEYIVNQYIRNRIRSGYLRDSLLSMAWAQLRADVTSSEAVLRSALFPDYEFTSYESAIEP